MRKYQSGQISLWALLMGAVVAGVSLAVVFPPEKIQQLVVEEEVRFMLQQIADQESGYFSERREYLSIEPFPDDPKKRPKDKRRKWGKGGGFDTLGVFPREGKAYCQYAVAADSESFTAVAKCDGNGNGIYAYYAYMRSSLGGEGTIPDPFGECLSSGVWAFDAPKTVSFPEANKIGRCTSPDGLDGEEF